MNTKRVVQELNKKYKDFISSIDDRNIRSLIINQTFITGGAIVSLLNNEKPNDFDIYFDNQDACETVINYFLDKMDKKLDEDYYIHKKINIKNNDEEEFKNRLKIYIPQTGTFSNNFYNNRYYPIFVSSNAISLTDKIQLIFRFIGNPEEIHANYDFEHTKCYYIPKLNKLVLPQKSLECILTKELIYTGSKYPLASILRTRKFIKRGWNINVGQYVKMAIQLNEFDLKDPVILSDQLVGVDIVLFDMVIAEIRKKENNITTSEIIEILDRVFDKSEKVDWDKEIYKNKE
jgi:hypothetical protein